jgi:voltage-gated potassium channel
MAIASHSPCPNAAVATAPSKLLVLDPIDFHALTMRHPKLAEHIRTLAQA